MMWSFELNSDDVLAQIIPLLEKDTNSKGSFQDDFITVCEQNKIIPCPYIKSSSNEAQETVKITNGVIDLTSWRAMLLAITCINSKVSEIYVHSSQITSQHVLELSKALEKSCTITTVRFQYLYLLITPTTTPLWIEALKSLFSDTTCLEYISFKGCRFGNEIITGAVSALNNNYKLKSFNLSDNLLSDETVSELFKAIKLKTNITELSFSKNHLSGTCLPLVSSLLTGVLDALPEDDAAVKANAKLLGDKNKVIKDNNKKRKKAGLMEIAECTASLDTITKKDGKNVIQNRTFTTLDFSANELSEENVTTFVTSLQQHSTPLVSSESKVQVLLRGVGSEVSPYEGDWVRVVV